MLTKRALVTIFVILIFNTVFCQKKAIINLGVNIKSIDTYEVGQLTSIGPEISTEYSLSPKFWSLLGQVSLNLSENRYVGWSFISGVNFSFGESQSGFYLGPRAGVRSDNYDRILSALYGMGIGFTLNPTKNLAFSLYGDLFLDSWTRYFTPSFGVKVGFKFQE